MSDEIIEDVKELRDHYDRGWVNDEVKRFVDRLDDIIEKHEE